MSNWTDNQISIAKESSYGTAVTPTVSVPVGESDGITPAQEIVGAEAVKTTPAKNKVFYKGKRTYEGGYVMDLYPSTIGLFLLSALGDVASALASGESAVYEHTFTEDPDKPSITVEQAIGDFVKRYAGYVVSRIQISGVVGEALKITIEGKAKTSANATKITAVYETNSPLTWADVTSITIGGTDFKAYIQEFNVEYMNGLEKFHGMGSEEPVAKYIKQSEYKGSFKMYVDTNTKALIEDNLDGTEQEVNILIEGASVGTAEKFGLEIDADKCAITSTSTPIAFDLNALDINFEAREDASTGLVQMVLTNEDSSY